MSKMSLSNPFFQRVVKLLDQHQTDYDEANSTTYGAATSLRETGELDFNFREYDSYLDQFYRVRIDSVNIYPSPSQVPVPVPVPVKTKVKGEFGLWTVAKLSLTTYHPTL